jgi:hypothetical protein
VQKPAGNTSDTSDVHVARESEVAVGAGAGLGPPAGEGVAMDAARVDGGAAFAGGHLGK